MKYIIITMLLCTRLWALGQEKKEVKVGDTIQDYPVTMLRTGKNTTIQELAKGRSIVVYYWGRRCVPCVNKLPMLDSLQKEFGKDILILAISPEQSPKDIGATAEFIESRPLLKQLSLALILDTTHRIYDDMTVFNENQLPELYNIWSDKKGIIKARTRSKYISRENILAFLKDKPLNIDDTEVK